jgi:hypothetical protein
MAPAPPFNIAGAATFARPCRHERKPPHHRMMPLGRSSFFDKISLYFDWEFGGILSKKAVD